MVGQRTYHVYILTNESGTLYTGMTGDLKGRVWHHRNKTADGFTKKYRIDELLYYECFSDAWSAIAREKEIKGWTRRKKLDLIASINPQWRDLSEDWYDSQGTGPSS